MRGIRTIFVLFFMLFWTAASAQWFKGGELYGGYGYGKPMEGMTDHLHHVLGNGQASFQYRKPGLEWTTKLNGMYESNPENSYRFEYNLSDTDNSAIKAISKNTTSQAWAFGLGTEVKWAPSRDRNYAVRVNYSFDRSDPVGLSLNSSLWDEGLITMQADEKEHRAHKFSQGVRTFHRLGEKGMTLHGELTLEESYTTDYTHLLLSDNFDEEDIVGSMNKIYTFSPSANYFSLNATLHLRDTLLSSSRMSLVLAPGIRASFGYNHDYYGGSKVTIGNDYRSDEFEAPDSTALTQRFRDRSLNLLPYFAVQWKRGPVMVNADYGLQLFARNISDEFKGMSKGSFKPYIVGASYLDWSVSKGHRLVFRNSVNVQHPSTRNLIWGPRYGGNLSVLVRGNPELKSTLSRNYSMEHRYNVKSFTVITRAGFVRANDEQDRTFSKETIDGKVYNVFFLVNSSDSWAVNFYHQLGWDGNLLAAHIGAQYNQIRRWPTAGGTVKDSNNWRIWADARVRFGKGWSLGADVTYQSKVNTIYSSVNDYWKLNSRLEKNFKKWTLYLEGRDLLDKNVELQFRSADGLSGWIDNTRKAWRLILLGIRWNL